MTEPRILKKGAIGQINDLLLEKTGCFAFLCEEPFWNYEVNAQTDPRIRFMVWNTALYSVYHDYGCKYLTFFLDEENVLPVGGSIDLQDVRRAKTHIRNVTGCFRPNYAHGVLASAVRENMKQILSDYYVRDHATLSWDDYYNQMQEADWEAACEKLAKDANLLYQILVDFANGGYCVNSVFAALSNIRTTFANSPQFADSIDKRLVFSFLDEDYKHYDATAGTVLTAERLLKARVPYGQPTDANSLLEPWRADIVTEFVAETLKTPADILRALRRKLDDLYHPQAASSVSVAAAIGFEIPSL